MATVFDMLIKRNNMATICSLNIHFHMAIRYAYKEEYYGYSIRYAYKEE